MLLMARHGLRVTEAVDLRWDQIDFSKGHLHVRRLREGETLPSQPTPGTALNLLCIIVPLTIVPQYSILEPQWTCSLPSSVGVFTCELHGRRFQFAHLPVVGDEQQQQMPGK